MRAKKLKSREWKTLYESVFTNADGDFELTRKLTREDPGRWSVSVEFYGGGNVITRFSVFYDYHKALALYSAIEHGVTSITADVMLSRVFSM